MAKGYQESQKYKDRARTQLEHRAKQRAAAEELGLVQPQRGHGNHVPECSPLEALINSGELTRLIIRRDGHDGAAFTVKADLEVGGASYLHGKVSDSWELSQRINEVISKGRWHSDKYPAKE